MILMPFRRRRSKKTADKVEPRPFTYNEALDDVSEKILRLLTPDWLMPYAAEGMGAIEGSFEERLLLCQRILATPRLDEALAPLLIEHLDDTDDGARHESWLWSLGYADFNHDPPVQSVRERGPDGTVTSEFVRVLGKIEGRATFCNEDGNLDTEKSGFYVRGKKVAE